MNPRLPRFTPSTGTPRMAEARARWRMVPSPPKAMSRSAERSSCCSGRQATPNCPSPPSGLKGRQYTVSNPTDWRMPSALLGGGQALIPVGVGAQNHFFHSPTSSSAP